MSIINGEAEGSQIVKDIRNKENQLAKLLIAAHHRVWPRDVDIKYTVMQRGGKAKIKFESPDIKEVGWTD